MDRTLPDGSHLNVVSLRDYVEARLAAIEKATDRYSSTMNDRLAGMNEFREAIKDQANRMATREEAEVIAKRLDRVERWQANMEGRLWALSVVLVLANMAIAVALRLWG